MTVVVLSVAVSTYHDNTPSENSLVLDNVLYGSSDL